MRLDRRGRSTTGPRRSQAPGCPYPRCRRERADRLRVSARRPRPVGPSPADCRGRPDTRRWCGPRNRGSPARPRITDHSSPRLPSMLEVAYASTATGCHTTTRQPPSARTRRASSPMLQRAGSRGACLANHRALERLVEHAIDGAADRGRWVMTHGHNVPVQRAVVAGCGCGTGNVGAPSRREATRRLN